MALDPTVANALLQSQLAMHAVNDPARIAALAASMGAIPPPIPAPVQVASADNSAIQVPQPQPAPPAPATPTSAQAAAPVAPAQAPAAAAAGVAQTPADYTPDASTVTPADYTPPVAMGPVTPEDYTPDAGPDQTGAQLANLGKALGAVAAPAQPAQPPAVHASPPQQGSYNPAVVTDFMNALMAAAGGGGKGGGLGPVASLGSLIGGR
jgi:hypothetical protein